MSEPVIVRRFPSNPGKSGWNALLPRAPDPVPLEGAQAADWLVIGAGFAGLSAARRLVQLHPGDRVVVLDAGRLGEGPSGRNSGFMVDLPHDLASLDYGGSHDSDLVQIRGNRAAITFATATAQAYDMARDALVHCGKINAAATKSGVQHNDDYAVHLTRLGEASERLDARQMRALTGSDYYLGGLFTPGTAVLQPAQYMREFRAGLSAEGVELFQDSAVQSLTREGDWVAQTRLGRVTAPKVILAVNGHAQSFGHFEGQLLHVYTYASMTRALTTEESAALGGDATWGLTPADPMGTSLRRIAGRGGSRILIRNRFTYDPAMSVPAGRMARIARDHDRAFAARFPMLAEVTMQYRWGGHLCLSRNSVPAFGEVDEGLFAACCQNGLGTTKGTLAGMLAAEKASGVASDLLRDFEAQAQPSRLPPRALTTPVARAMLRIKEYRAGAEL